jgi:hypothetical protein
VSREAQSTGRGGQTETPLSLVAREGTEKLTQEFLTRVLDVLSRAERASLYSGSESVYVGVCSVFCADAAPGHAAVRRLGRVLVVE